MLYEILMDSRVLQKNQVHIKKITRPDRYSGKIYFHENNMESSSRMWPIESRISNTKTQKDNRILLAVTNHNKAITAGVAPTIQKSHKNYEKADQ